MAGNATISAADGVLTRHSVGSEILCPARGGVHQDRMWAENIEKSYSAVSFRVRLGRKAEIEARKLYSDLQYYSLYDYCVHELNYSEDQAYRRISAMRLSRQIPLVKEKIREGSISLSNANMLSGFFKEVTVAPKEKDSLINLSTNRSKKECQKILDNFRVDRGIPVTPKRLFLKADTSETIRINISLANSTMDKINTLKGSYAHKKVELPQLFDHMADALIEKKHVVIKRKIKPHNSSTTTRYISKQIKVDVTKRANNCCELCGSVHALEFDHITPYSQGGSSSMGNIRLLCRNCNLREGIKTFGKTKMKRA